MREIVTLLCIGSLLVPSGAYGQEVAAPGVIANFDDEIVVIGQRREMQLPLPYEAEMHLREDTFTAERDLSGRTHFTYTRPILDLGDNAGIEFHREWHDGRGSDGVIPENEPPDFRGVLRW